MVNTLSLADPVILSGQIGFAPGESINLSYFSSYSFPASKSFTTTFFSSLFISITSFSPPYFTKLIILVPTAAILFTLPYLPCPVYKLFSFYSMISGTFGFCTPKTKNRTQKIKEMPLLFFAFGRSCIWPEKSNDRPGKV